MTGMWRQEALSRLKNLGSVLSILGIWGEIPELFSLGGGF